MNGILSYNIFVITPSRYLVILKWPRTRKSRIIKKWHKNIQRNHFLGRIKWEISNVLDTSYVIDHTRRAIYTSPQMAGKLKEILRKGLNALG